MEFLPIGMIFTPIIFSLIVYLMKSQKTNALVFVAQTIISVLAIIYYSHYFGAFEDTFVVLGAWDSRIGISLMNDELSMVFVSLSIFVWWMILIYSFSKSVSYDFLFFLMFMQGVFLALLQTNDLFNMFVFIELTTILVTIVIAFNKAGYAFRAALYYLLLNTSGVLLFLIGIIFIYFTFGTININYVSDNMALHADNTIVHMAYVLMMAGISVKAALFPVFTWLPKAHGAAKSAVSALLSGLIVKAGIYLFLRINEMYAAAEFPYHTFFFVIGALTGIIGIVFAISQYDIKQMLAYSTVSQIGLIMMALSSPDASISAGGILHVVNHGLFKMLLFLIAGMIVKVYLSKKITDVRGMFKSMPVVSATMVIAMLAITGMPFLNGYVTKSMIMYGYGSDSIQYWVIFIMNIGTATLFIKMSQIFFGPKQLSYPMTHIRQNTVLVIISVVIIIMGNWFFFMDTSILGIDSSVLNPLSFSAFFDYALTLGLAGLAYIFLVKRENLVIRRLKDFSLSFEHANYIFVSYTVLLTIVFIFLFT